MIKFTDRQTLTITAARCVGLLKAMQLDPCRHLEDDQQFFESEYITLYAMLQDIAFIGKETLNWILLGELEKHVGVTVMKSEFGFLINYQDLNVEVAPKRLGFVNGGRQVIRTKVSELRTTKKGVIPMTSENLVRGTEYRHVDWSRA